MIDVVESVNEWASSAVVKTPKQYEWNLEKSIVSHESLINAQNGRNSALSPRIPNFAQNGITFP